ncbi:MAG: MBL fold metallo-hydrolase [Bacteroidales bacterium]|jgi:glyoxylase-like metal-dependent hydrolase (beta-lactamase superfamily II)|nr:MBL fold metallo-hydrolase [Bacteroidales bacterium]
MLSIEPLVFNSFQVNTYLIRNEKGDCMVIDPAFYSPDEIKSFDRYITSKGLTVIGQLNTHCHVDHVLGVKHMQTTYKCPLRAHPDELSLLHNAPLMGEMFGLQVEALSGIDKPISDGEIIAVGEDSLRAILVPGHSPGSLSFYAAEAEFVVTGDALFQGSIGRTDLPGGDYDTLISSIQNRLLTLPPGTTVYPGHGDPTTVGEEASSNPFLSMA